MCLRKISTAIIACLILLIPAFFDVFALAESGKPVHRKAIIVQPGEEVIVTDTASGPSPQKAEATGLDAVGGKGSVINGGAVLAEAKADTAATAKGASAGTRSVGINGSGGKDSILNNGTLSSKATSTVTSLSLFVNIDGFTLPFMRKFPPVIGESLAASFAAGILGGNGNGILEHSGVMTVEATSTAAAGSINVNLTGKDEKVFSKAIPAVWAVKPPVMKADSSGKSVSEAVGIDGGSGADHILSTGPMTVKASATSAAGSLNLNLGNDARPEPLCRSDGSGNRDPGQRRQRRDHQPGVNQSRSLGYGRGRCRHGDLSHRQGNLRTAGEPPGRKQGAAPLFQGSGRPFGNGNRRSRRAERKLRG